METPTPIVPLRCPHCGADNAPEAIVCVQCGQPLVASQSQPQGQLPWPPPPQGQYAPQYSAPPDNTLGGLIPFKNSAALTSYYLAVFSLIPCLGLFLGIAAFVLGLRGLKFSKEHPEAKGSAHAWTGIILGGLCGFGSLIGVIVMIVLSALNQQH